MPSDPRLEADGHNQVSSIRQESQRHTDSCASQRLQHQIHRHPLNKAPPNAGIRRKKTHPPSHLRATPGTHAPRHQPSSQGSYGDFPPHENQEQAQRKQKGLGSWGGPSGHAKSPAARLTGNISCSTHGEQEEGGLDTHRRQSKGEDGTPQQRPGCESGPRSAGHSHTAQA